MKLNPALFFSLEQIQLDVHNLQSYEARIDALQRQVEEQSMTMSMYSSYTPEDFNNIEEDIFGEYIYIESFIEFKTFVLHLLATYNELHLFNII